MSQIERDSLGGAELLWTADPDAPRIGEGNRLTPGQKPPSKKKDSEEKADDNDGDSSKAGEKPKKTPLYKRPILMTVLVLIAVIAIVLATIYFVHAGHFINTDDAFVDAYIIQSAPRVAGQVDDLRIVDNQFVTKGQVLLTLDPKDYAATLRQMQANESSMAGKLQQAKSNKAVAEANVAQAQAELEVTQVNAENAERDYQRYANLDERARSKQQLDNVTAAQRANTAQVAQAKAKVSEMNAQIAAADSAIKTAEADADRAAADVEQARLNLGYCTIIAPADGYVTNRSVYVGNYVSVGQAMFSLVSKDVWVMANLKETELDHVRVGQPVSIHVDAYPDKTYHGKVDSVMAGAGARFSLLPPENATGNYIKVVQRVPVKIVINSDELGDPVFKLGPGMSVVPEIDIRSALH